VTAHAAVESLTVENLELREELDAAHAECDDWNLTCENYEKSLAVERARVQKVLDLCNDPGGPDSWSHTFDGRASIFVEDVLAAIGDAP
jgi:hypothetical protein